MHWPPIFLHKKEWYRGRTSSTCLGHLIPINTAIPNTHTNLLLLLLLHGQEGDDEAPASPKGPETHLYGLWQTQGWQAPVATDGVVPKNERGNVQVPPFAAALPEVRLLLLQKAVMSTCTCH